MIKLVTTLIFIAFVLTSYCQTTSRFAETLRIKHHIPELAYAVVSADSIFELEVLGVQRINTKYKAN
jgi:hypothetical protein